MSGLGIVFLVVFAILAAISNAKKAGRGTGVPPGSRLPPRPGQLPGRVGMGQAPAPRAGDGPAAEPQRAADLVPDDLWAILTGERRPPLRPVETAREMALPAPPPRRSVTEPVSLSQQGMAERGREEQGLLAQKRADLARAMAAEVTRQQPAGIVAAVAASGPNAQPPAVAAPVPARPGPRRSRGLISSPAELRRAMVLRTVLGPPKVLE